MLLLAAGAPCVYGEGEVPYPTEREHPEEAEAFRETLMEVWINGVSTGRTAMMLRKGAILFAGRQDLEAWRFRFEGTPPVTYRGRTYYRLDAIEGVTYRLEPKRMLLRIDAGAAAFVPTRFETSRSAERVDVSSPGLFFNYDLIAQRETSRTDFSALGEIGLFRGYGLLLNDFVCVGGSERSELVRLESRYRTDRPEALETLTVGDAITKSASLWGSAVRFGGVQWGTNFRIRPDLVTTPLFRFGGEAVLPSSVDLYINGVLRERRDVPPGPFTIDHPPTVSGSGDARMVVTDILGRQQVISSAFYASPGLLRSGLEAYSLEAGFIRENFGLQSNDYGRFLASGTYRAGISDTLTAELHGQLTRGQQTAGTSAVWLWNGFGTFSAAAAASRSETARGVMGMAGFERAARRLSFGGTVKGSSEAFVQIGSTLPPPSFEGRLYAGYTLPGAGAFRASVVRRDYRDRDDITLIGAGYHHSWRNVGSLQLSLNRSIAAGETGDSLALYFTRAFGKRRTGIVGLRAEDGSAFGTVRLKKSLPTGPGTGYSLTADFGERERLEALYEWQHEYGSYSVGASHTEETDTVRATARGGVAFLDGNGFLSRRINGSFAVVDTGEFPGVAVYRDNRYMGKTDTDAKLLIPDLRAYEKNPIRVDEASLPLEASLPSLTAEAVPAYRSGVLVRFPLERVNRALMKVVLEDGRAVPAGARVRVEGRDAQFPVGREGKVYLEGVSRQNRVRIFWHGGSCGFVLDYPETEDPLPDLGEFRCQGDTR
jgi:outer membrane usher protein